MTTLLLDEGDVVAVYTADNFESVTILDTYTQFAGFCIYTTAAGERRH